MRVIDADAFDERVRVAGGMSEEELTEDFKEGVQAVLYMLSNQPTIQPEIIRCKDCDWWTKQEDSPQGRCTLLRIYPTGGWFCGNARRRETTA